MVADTPDAANRAGQPPWPEMPCQALAWTRFRSQTPNRSGRFGLRCKDPPTPSRRGRKSNRRDRRCKLGRDRGDTDADGGADKSARTEPVRSTAADKASYRARSAYSSRTGSPRPAKPESTETIPPVDSSFRVPRQNRFGRHTAARRLPPTAKSSRSEPRTSDAWCVRSGIVTYRSSAGRNDIRLCRACADRQDTRPPARVDPAASDLSAESADPILRAAPDCPDSRTAAPLSRCVCMQWAVGP